MVRSRWLLLTATPSVFARARASRMIVLICRLCVPPKLVVCVSCVSCVCSYACFGVCVCADISNSSFVQFQIWDFPGQLDFFDPAFDSEAIFGGCGALIFVIDAQDEYDEALRKLHMTVTKAIKVNPRISFEVFIHKVDGLSDDHKIGKCPPHTHHRTRTHTTARARDDDLRHDTTNDQRRQRHRGTFSSRRWTIWRTRSWTCT